MFELQLRRVDSRMYLKARSHGYVLVLLVGLRHLKSEHTVERFFVEIHRENVVAFIYFPYEGSRELRRNQTNNLVCNLGKVSNQE